MKSELLLAFNQICAERNLSREVVMEAIRAAIVSAYRRDVGAPPQQNITAQIDLETGRTRIFAERRVVAQVTDPQTEISLEEARRLHPNVQLGETLMVDSTPHGFGRIAAQAARQRIMQCIREAEREARYNRLVEQEGELAHGIVQSVTPQGVILHLDRTEAILPRKEMVPGEHYALHDRIRVYVLEVNKTPRGPQIIVSRSHKKMLQRLLELEVPEIQSGAIEIKAIAREAGSRSKVAVASRQPGLDPVGSCIGVRGTRIQSILRELGNEKVDIIEWSPDPVTFIAKALGPARVLSVVLDEDSTEPIAYVVVPDDQLSLAIGKNGQNARLAAKLTGWRIDIQSATEAVQWALRQIKADPDILAALGPAAESLPQVEAALARRNQEKMSYTAEELLAMRQVIEKVRGYVLELKASRRGRRKSARARLTAAEEERRAREAAIQEARARIPAHTYQIPISQLGLSERTRKHLERHQLTTVGLLLERLAEGEEGLLRLEGIGARVLAEICEAVEPFRAPAPPAEAPTPEAVPEPEAREEAVPAEIAPPAAGEPAVPVAAATTEAVPTEPSFIPEETAPTGPEFLPEETIRTESALPYESEEPSPVQEAIPGAEPVAELPGLEATPATRMAPLLQPVVPVEETEFEEETEEWEEPIGERKRGRKPPKRHKRPPREYIYDEELGRTVAIRRHRRRGEDWEEF
ncbi:MAG: transcription termination factor NusA [Anaerolineae bacterium]|nr:transcription termination factor NusA [Anaerolineae bacterium]MDW8069467.1 transcription termination factor NusA [Anaerolineae bacterium]